MNYERLTRPVDHRGLSFDSVSWHTRSRQEFETYAKLVVRRAVEQGPAAVAELGPHLLESAFSPKMLRCVWDHLARSGGQAPGPNGRRYSDLAGDEVWSLLQAVGQSLRDGVYLPQPARRIEVPKDPLNPGQGTRPISLINIEDRVVQRSIVELLVPLRDPHLGELVVGSRPRRSRWHALARLERLATESKRWVWLAADIQNCFENVRRNRLRDVLRKRIPGNELVEQMMRLIDNGRKHGIQQGGPLSPFLLNEYLDHFLDRRWLSNRPDIPLLRYVDDLLAVCRTKKEARQAWTLLVDTLQAAGMQLRGEAPICDLRRGETIDWLGCSIGRDGSRLRIRIAARAWSRLAGKLALAHEQPNAPLRAVAVIEGWIDQLGPMHEFEDRSVVLNRIQDMAAAQEFDELPTRDALRQRWRRARDRWEEIRTAESSPMNSPKPPTTPWLPEASDNVLPPFDVAPAVA